MFTGIVEELGKVQSLKKQGKSLCLGIEAEKISAELKIGDSVAVNGVCLTIVEIKPCTVLFDCIGETLELTNLGNLKLKESVNLERPLKADSFLSGHFVSGHIDGVGKILKKVNKGEQLDLYVEAGKGILAYLVPKGSIALDGISLTLVEIGKDSFSVSLIPHTLKMTTLGFKGVGDFVNIEVDILAKYVKQISHPDNQNASNITLDFLKSHGFA